MAQTSEHLTITSVQARKAILMAFKSQRPVFLWGPPGIGKSDVVASITEELGGYMIDLRVIFLLNTPELNLQSTQFIHHSIDVFDKAIQVSVGADLGRTLLKFRAYSVPV